MVTSAPTLRELGERLGIDGEELERTAARYNEHAVDGEDPEFGRGTNRFVTKYAGDPAHEPNALVGPVAEAPFHGMKLTVVGTGIGSSGVRIDGEGHVLSAEGGPRIEGLYAVGSCAALTSSGSGYNSGFALGRGLTLAYLVSNELGGVTAPRRGDRATRRLRGPARASRPRPRGRTPARSPRRTGCCSARSRRSGARRSC